MIRRAIGPTTTTPGYALVLANAKVLPRLAVQDHDKRSDGFTLALGAQFPHGSMT